MVKIAIYDRYLSTAGGGERYSCKMAEILSENPDYQVDLMTDLYTDLGEVSSRLNLDLTRVNLKLFPYISDDFELDFIEKKYNDFLKFLNKEYWFDLINAKSFDYVLEWFEEDEVEVYSSYWRRRKLKFSHSSYSDGR